MRVPTVAAACRSFEAIRMMVADSFGAGFCSARPSAAINWSRSRKPFPLIPGRRRWAALSQDFFSSVPREAAGQGDTFFRKQSCAPAQNLNSHITRQPPSTLVKPNRANTRPKHDINTMEMWRKYGDDRFLLTFSDIYIISAQKFKARSAPPERALPHPVRCALPHAGTAPTSISVSRDTLPMF